MDMEFKALGKHVTAPSKTLETFPKPAHVRTVTMVCDEVTSLCPVTGQPDFETITIEYEPDAHCIESKSLKLYLWSYRNDGIFYERAVNRILDDLVASSSPRWMRVVGDFNVRGGVKSMITATHGKAPSSK